jgi:MFS family permease
MSKLKLASFGAFGYAWSLFLSSQYIQTRFLDFFQDAYFIGAILSVHSLFGMLIIPITNRISDKIQRRKPIMLISALGISMSLIGITFDSLLGVILFTIIFYLFFVIYEGVYILFFSEQKEDEIKRTLHFSISAFLGGIFLFLFGSITLHYYSWAIGFRIIFLSSSIMLLIFYFIPIIFVPENFIGDKRSKDRRVSLYPALPKDVKEERRIKQNRKSINLSNKVKIFCLIHGLYIFSIGCFNSFHVLFLKKTLEFSNSEISILMLIIVAFNFIGIILLYFISKKVRVINILIYCTIGLTAAFPFFYFIKTYLYLSFLSMLIGIFLGGIQSQQFTIINEISEKGKIEKSLSLYLKCSYLGTLTSGFLLGFLIEYINKIYNNMTGYYSVYLISTLILAFTLFSVLIWKKKFLEQET